MCLVDQVLGNAGTGEGDDALGQKVQEVVVAPERRGPSVGGPVGLADDLVHALALGPLGGDALDAGAAAMDEDEVVVFGLGLVEAVEDGSGIGDVLAACDGDQGALGHVRAYLAVLAGADEVAGVDGRRGELPGAVRVRTVARAPDVAGLDAIGISRQHRATSRRRRGGRRGYGRGR